MTTHRGWLDFDFTSRCIRAVSTHSVAGACRNSSKYEEEGDGEDGEGDEEQADDGAEYGAYPAADGLP